MNYCIVTPDCVGPIKNGGIGTHCFHLANFLINEGHSVDILFTGPFQEATFSEVRRFYAQKNICFESISELNAESYEVKFDTFFTQNSMRVYDFLKNKNYVHVFFQDWQANGLRSIQAKETGLSFSKTTLSVTMHSSQEWILEGMKSFSDRPLESLKQNWGERYCCEKADLLLSPSQHMFEWAQSKSWVLAENRKVIPNLCPPLEGRDCYSPQKNAIAFFGRLETRKGLELFLNSFKGEALHQSKIKKIFFIGKLGVVSNGESADSYIRSFFSKHLKGLDFEIISHLDFKSALNFIRKNQLLVCVPSLLDNYPFTVLECVQNGIPIIASNSGGIPEMLKEEFLFSTHVFSLQQKINSLFQLDFSKESLYSYENSLSLWKEILKIKISKENCEKNLPLVSVCIAHYNYGKFLPTLLRSLNENRQFYQNFEVVIVDDGSSQDSSKKVFIEEREKYSSLNWKFISKENEGIGLTRNFAAAHSQGKYLLFVDADNVATPEMVADFVVAIERSEADCVTCFYKGFLESVENPKNDSEIVLSYQPLGSCVEASLLENVYGDANFIIKKSVFEKIGKFSIERHLSNEDWELLSNLVLSGFRLEVMPKMAFWYRVTEGGMSRNTNQHDNQKRVLRTFKKHVPTHVYRLLDSYVLPVRNSPSYAFWGHLNEVLFIKKGIDFLISKKMILKKIRPLFLQSNLVIKKLKFLFRSGGKLK